MTIKKPEFAERCPSYGRSGVMDEENFDLMQCFEKYIIREKNSYRKENHIDDYLAEATTI